MRESKRLVEGSKVGGVGLEVRDVDDCFVDRLLAPGFAFVRVHSSRL